MNLFGEYKKLPPFERWQILLSIASTIALILTFIVAIFIGWKQNQINQNILDLNYEPSITIAYIAPKTNATVIHPEDGRWHVSNYGKENISVTNIILRADNIPNLLRNNTNFFLNGKGKLIAPSGSEYFYAPATDATIEAYKKQILNGGAQIPLEVYFQSTRDNGDSHHCFINSVS